MKGWPRRRGDQSPEPPPAASPSAPSPTAMIRWMIRRDMEEVLAIEQQSYPNPWSEEEFIRVLRRRNSIGMVFDDEDQVRGFVIYELHATRLQVLNFAVAAAFRRRGIGGAMVRKLVNKLTVNRRSRILVEVRESNLDAQLFFRAQGFRAARVLSDLYDDSDEDAYLFQYRFRADQEEPEHG